MRRLPVYASADEFREPCFSNQRRLGPQITVGLLNDVEGFPLTVKAFEDNKAESTAAPPVIRNSQQHIDVNGVAIGVNAGFFARQYRIEGLARQTLRGSDEQLGKKEHATAKKLAVELLPAC